MKLVTNLGELKSKAKRRNLVTILLTLFILVSIFYMSPLAPAPTQPSYTTLETKLQDGSVRRDFVDSTGAVFQPANRSYATVVKTYDEQGRLIKQVYYDSVGAPVTLPSGEHGETRVYTDEGTIITFINTAGHPTRVNNGYYRKVVTYPTHSDDEHVSVDMYYDLDGVPVLSVTGVYGTRYVYDSSWNLLEMDCLDKDGTLMTCNAGYAIKRQGHTAGETIEAYYDVNGEPVALSKGQYGVKTIHSHTVYLDADGRPLFDINSLLSNHPWLVVVAGLVLVVLVCSVSRQIRWILLAAYVGVVVYFTLMFREPVSGGVGILKAWTKVFVDTDATVGILENIWLFIPAGAAMASLALPASSTTPSSSSATQSFPPSTVADKSGAENKVGTRSGTKRIGLRWIWLLVALSLIIELLQYFTGLGYAELDDLISNSLGAFIGAAMYLTSHLYHGNMPLSQQLTSSTAGVDKADRRSG